MTDTMEYPKQSASQNKKPLQEFLEKKGYALDDIEFEYIADLAPLVGTIACDSPEIVGFEKLPDDIENCTVLGQGRRVLTITIRPTKLTASTIPDPENA